jgi:hypothetical protein
MVLGKTGRSNTEIKDIHASTLPLPLKDWIYLKILRQDSIRTVGDFQHEFTDYLVSLPWAALTDGDAILDEVWCRPGRTGIVVFLVGLYWQALDSAIGTEWHSNIKHVEMLFEAILAAPSL